MQERNLKQKKHFDKRENRYNAWLMENPPFHTRLEIREIIKRIPRRIGKNYIIDFGSGNGRITIELLKKRFNVLAVDTSYESLKDLKKNVERLRLRGLKTTTKLGKIKRSKLIVGADILHHVNLNSSLPAIYRCLKKEGKIIFSEPGAWNLFWYIYLPLVSSWDVEKGMSDCSYFNLRNKLLRAGYKKIKITGLGFFPRPFFNFLESLCKFNDWLGNVPILKLFAYRFIIEAVK